MSDTTTLTPPVSQTSPETSTAFQPRDVGEYLRRTVRHHGPVLALYGVLKLIGFSVFMYLLDSDGGFRTRNPRFGGGAHAWDVLATWDGWWYQQIAAHGYHPALVQVPGATGLITLEGNSAAFFPSTRRRCDWSPTPRAWVCTAPGCWCRSWRRSRRRSASTP